MRLEKGIKQNDVANKIGVASSTLAHYESEYRPITLETAKQIADICDFEIIFKNKNTKKEFIFDDMKQMTYDIRVKDTKK